MRNDGYRMLTGWLAAESSHRVLLMVHYILKNTNRRNPNVGPLLAVKNNYVYMYKFIVRKPTISKNGILTRKSSGRKQ
jgi:hypothetical protein